MRIRPVSTMMLLVAMLFTISLAPAQTYAADEPDPDMQVMLFGEFEDDFVLDHSEPYYSPVLASTGYVFVWLDIVLNAGESLTFTYEWYNEANNSWDVVNTTVISGPKTYYNFTLNDPYYEQLGVYRIGITTTAPTPASAHIYGEYMAW
ncbi:hypothetical protein ACE3MZ_11225 [Paenibacillus sp. WLX1005]|uniref:hypothetical protein n=1 Tax=unclassified Paenibacillus TaxID=185978 RepID=UPI003983E657